MSPEMSQHVGLLARGMASCHIRWTTLWSRRVLVGPTGYLPACDCSLWRQPFEFTLQRPSSEHFCTFSTAVVPGARENILLRRSSTRPRAFLVIQSRLRRQVFPRCVRKLLGFKKARQDRVLGGCLMPLMRLRRANRKSATATVSKYWYRRFARGLALICSSMTNLFNLRRALPLPVPLCTRHSRTEPVQLATVVGAPAK